MNTHAVEARSPEHKHPRLEYSLTSRLNASLFGDTQPPGDGSAAASWLQPASTAALPAEVAPPAVPSPLEVQVANLAKMVEMHAQMHMQNKASVSSAPPPVAAQPPVARAAAADEKVLSQAETSAKAAPMDTTYGTPGSAAMIDKLKSSVKLPNEILAAMKSEAAKFGKLLRTLGRSRLMVEKLEKRLNDLRSGTLPPGCKPWKPKDESLLWRKALGNEASAGMPFNIGPDTMLEDAKKNWLSNSTCATPRSTPSTRRSMSQSSSKGALLMPSYPVARPWEYLS